MKLRRVVVCLMIAVMCAGLFTGCGGNNETADDGKVVISVSDFFPDKDTMPEDYQRALDRVAVFEELHPNIKIEDPAWSFTVDTYMAKAEAGTLPSTYRVALTELNSIIDLGYAMDVTDELKERGIYEYLPDAYMDLTTRDGNVYFILPDLYDVGIGVNLDLYAQAGFVAEDGTPYQPETWDDLARVAAEITEKTGKAGFAMPTRSNCGGWMFAPIAWSYGVDFEEEIDGKWTATFNSPEGEAALGFIKDLKWKYNTMPENTLLDVAGVANLLSTGEVAMVISGEDQMASWVQHYGMPLDSVGLIKLPAGPAKHVTLIGGVGQVVNPNLTPEQVDAVFEWLAFTGNLPILDDEIKASIDSQIQSDLENGNLVGLVPLPSWTEDSPLVAYRKEQYLANMNVNENHVKQYNEKTGIEFQAEEPKETQALYTLLDNCLQEVLNNENADVAAVLEEAAANFQNNYLDYVE